MDVGPVELIVLTFPGERADPEVVAALEDVVSNGYVTVLDLVYFTRLDSGEIKVTDVDEGLDAAGFGTLQVNGQALVNEDDMAVVRDALEPGTSAAVIVYEQTWARGFAGAVRAAGGELALHVQVPHDDVVAALDAVAAS